MTRRAQKLLVRSRPLCIFAQIMPVEKRSDGWRDTPCAGVAVGSLQLSIFAHLHRLWLLNLYLFLCSCFSWFRRDVALTSLQRSDSWNEVLAQPPRQRLKVSGALLAVLHVVMCHMSRSQAAMTTAHHITIIDHTGDYAFRAYTCFFVVVSLCFASTCR